MSGVATVGVVEFATSGSTGEPVRWRRTVEQLDAEAALLASVCGAGGADGIDGIVCYPPPRHLYGYLMGRALPDLLGVPCRQVGVTDPPQRAFAGLRRPLVAALPAAFAALRRALPVLRRLDRTVVVHSSAMLPAAGPRLVSELDGRARLVELFGSTETGLVAARTGGPLWTLAPDTRFAAPLAAGYEGALRVCGPRLAHRPDRPAPTDHVLDDLVSIVDDRTFRWLGRLSRLVKVNGRRVHLDAVQDALREAVSEVSIEVRATGDEVRGEWFDVVVGDPGAVRAVAAACRRLPAWQQPRTVRSGEEQT